MYHKIEVESLSPAQIGKLLRGDRIRVKKGRGHHIAVSEEQHKKIHKAHLKGCGSTIQFDPFQQHAHQHMKGSQGVQGGSTFAQRQARRARNTFKPLAKALAPVANTLRSAGNEFIDHARSAGNEFASHARHLGEQGFNELKHAGRELGHQLASHGSDILSGLVQYGPQIAEMAALAPIGLGLRKRRGRGKGKGGALVAAGYGVGGRRRGRR